MNPRGFPDAGVEPSALDAEALASEAGAVRARTDLTGDVAATVATAAAMVMAAAVLLLWGVGVAGGDGLAPQLAQLDAGAAVIALFLGASILLLPAARPEGRPLDRYGIWACATFAAGAILFSLLSDASLLIAQMPAGLVHQTWSPPPWHARSTGVFVALALSAAMFPLRSSWAALASQGLLMAALAVAGGALLAELYGGRSLERPPLVDAMHWPTHLMQVALALALIAAHSSAAARGANAGTPIISRMTWPTLAYVAPISILIGALGARAAADGILDPPSAIAAAIALTLLLLAGVLARNMADLALRTWQRDEALASVAQSEARLKLAQSMAAITTLDWDIAGDKAIWSENFPEVFGVGRAPGPGKSPYERLIALVHPDDRARVDAIHLKLLKDGGAFSEEFRVVTSSGETRWIASRGAMVLGAGGLARRMVSANFDITKRRDDEERLKRSLDLIELANEAGEIGVWHSDIASRTGGLDERAAKIFGLPDGVRSISFDAFLALIRRDHLAGTRQALAMAVRDGEKLSLEFCIRVDAVDRWVRVRGQSERDPGTSRSTRLLGVVFDVTARRETEERLRFMMREITHRTKNLLAVIESMARQTGGAATSLADFQGRFSARLHSLAASHDLLINENWQGAYLSDVVRSQIGDLTQLVDARIRLSGPPFQLTPVAAQNIGLAMHELSTNAAKFGALSNSDGMVDIRWEVASGERGERGLKIVWQESGGPPVAPPGNRGFGSTVIERIVARALEGSVVLTHEPGGLRWTLFIPEAHVVENSARKGASIASDPFPPHSP